MEYCTPDDFRAAMARWCTGVSVVTVRDGDQNHGMTVSAFSSVSLHPPTILVCLDSHSRTAEIIARRRCFAVNILSAGQSDVSDCFAGRGDENHRFDGIPYCAGESGLPLLESAVANLECTVTKEATVGDHTVFFGGVSNVDAQADIDPLLYFRGDYRQIVYGRRRKRRR